MPLLERHAPPYSIEELEGSWEELLQSGWGC